MSSVRDMAHIRILHHESTPSDLLDDFCLAAKPLDVQRIRRPAESYVQASLEDLIIPAVAIFLLKPFFTAFLSEAGKDSYALLKRSLQRTWSRFFGNKADVQFRIVTSAGEKASRYFPCLAIFAAVRNDLVPLKFVFHNSYSKEEYDKYIDAIVEFLRSYTSEPVANSASRSVGGYLVVVFDRESQTLRIANDANPSISELSRKEE